MIRFKKKSIEIFRGDTGTLTLSIDQTDADIKSYEITLTVKKSVYDEDAVLQVKAEDGVIKFTHELTDVLEPGTYLYDIEFVKDGEYSTFGVYNFVVLADITR